MIVVTVFNTSALIEFQEDSFLKVNVISASQLIFLRRQLECCMAASAPWESLVPCAWVEGVTIQHAPSVCGTLLGVLVKNNGNTGKKKQTNEEKQVFSESNMLIC